MTDRQPWVHKPERQLTARERLLIGALLAASVALAALGGVVLVGGGIPWP